jgi:hypothetical protein
MSINPNADYGADWTFIELEAIGNPLGLMVCVVTEPAKYFNVLIVKFPCLKKFTNPLISTDKLLETIDETLTIIDPVYGDQQSVYCPFDLHFKSLFK